MIVVEYILKFKGFIKDYILKVFGLIKFFVENSKWRWFICILELICMRYI